jgi:hypothetical protein
MGGSCPQIDEQIPRGLTTIEREMTSAPGGATQSPACPQPSRRSAGSSNQSYFKLTLAASLATGRKVEITKLENLTYGADSRGTFGKLRRFPVNGCRTIKRFGDRIAIGIDARQQFDAPLGPFQELVGLPQQLDPLFIMSQRFVQPQFALFEQVDDFLEPLERLLEIRRFKLLGG